MTNQGIKEKLSKHISNKSSKWLEKAKWHEDNEDWLNKSALIAIKILKSLRNQSISQKDLAESIGVSPQYINKAVKGRENFSLETISKIEKALGITLISVSSFEMTQEIIFDYVDSTSFIDRNLTQSVISEKRDYEQLLRVDYINEPDYNYGKAG